MGCFEWNPTSKQPTTGFSAKLPCSLAYVIIWADVRTAIIGIFLAAFISAYPGQRRPGHPVNGQLESKQAINQATSTNAQNAATDPGQASFRNRKSFLTKAFGPEYLATWILVLAALVGLFATFYTLSTIRAQTTTIQKSVELQETFNQQWLAINGWRREGGSSREHSPPKFSIAMDIANPTDIPLTVKEIKTIVRGKSIRHSVNNKLGPGRSIKCTSGEIILSPEETALYMRYRLTFGFSGYVVYEDAFGKEKHQSFSEWCVLGQGNYFEHAPVEISDQDRDKQTQAE